MQRGVFHTSHSSSVAKPWGTIRTTKAMFPIRGGEFHGVPSLPNTPARGELKAMLSRVRNN